MWWCPHLGMQWLCPYGDALEKLACVCTRRQVQDCQSKRCKQMSVSGVGPYNEIPHSSAMDELKIHTLLRINLQTNVERGKQIAEENIRYTVYSKFGNKCSTGQASTGPSQGRPDSVWEARRESIWQDGLAGCQRSGGVWEGICVRRVWCKMSTYGGWSST